MLVAAGTTATGQRNPVKLFENVSHVCSSMARSGFEQYLSDHPASWAEKRTSSFMLDQAVVQP